jgi:hypothetical protein
MEFEVVYKKSVCSTLYAMFGNGVTYFWRETFPDGSRWAFKGYLKNFGTESETEDGVIRNSITIKVTGKPTFTPGS